MGAFIAIFSVIFFMVLPLRARASGYVVASEQRYALEAGLGRLSVFHSKKPMILVILVLKIMVQE